MNELPQRARRSQVGEKAKGDANPELPTKSFTKPKISDPTGQDLMVDWMSWN
jgi:hypothetical protein